MYNWESLFNLICAKYTGESLKEKYEAKGNDLDFESLREVEIRTKGRFIPQ